MNQMSKAEIVRSHANFVGAIDEKVDDYNSQPYGNN